MPDFGFKRATSNAIDMDKVDMGLYDRLARTEPLTKSCIACGSCSAVCVGGAYSGMSVRKIIIGLQRSLPLRPMLEGCMLCGKCSMVCPKGINTRHIVLSLERVIGDDRG